MSARKPLKVQHAGSTSLSLHQHPLFPLADRHAATILVETVTNGDIAGTSDALTELMCRSHYYKQVDFNKLGDVGDLMNACYEAGLMLGLAFGQRLRGAA